MKFDIRAFSENMSRKRFDKNLTRKADNFHEDDMFIYDTRNIALNSAYDEKRSTLKMRRKSTGAFCFQYGFSLPPPPHRKNVPFMRLDV
jgi:hypothetical protein